MANGIFIPGLKYRLNIGLNYSQNQSDNYNGGPETFVNANTSLAAADRDRGQYRSPILMYSRMS
jgi:hypothetical protein